MATCSLPLPLPFILLNTLAKESGHMTPEVQSLSIRPRIARSFISPGVCLRLFFPAATALRPRQPPCCVDMAGHVLPGALDLRPASCPSFRSSLNCEHFKGFSVVLYPFLLPSTSFLPSQFLPQPSPLPIVLFLSSVRLSVIATVWFPCKQGWLAADIPR